MPYETDLYKNMDKYSMIHNSLKNIPPSIKNNEIIQGKSLLQLSDNDGTIIEIKDNKNTILGFLSSTSDNLN